MTEEQKLDLMKNFKELNVVEYTTKYGDYYGLMFAGVEIATKKLQEENERLKKESEENQDLATIAYMQGASRNKAELDKAKEIIKKYNDVAEKILTYKKRDIEKISKIKKCAESFLEGERNCTFRTSKGELNNEPGTIHKIEYRS